MKKINTKKQIRSPFSVSLLMLAIVLGAGLSTSKTYTIKPGSAYGPRMLEAMVINSEGKVKERRYGFPIAYKDKTTVISVDPSKAGFADSSFEEQGLSYGYLLLNVLFWYGLLFTARESYRFFKKQ